MIAFANADGGIPQSADMHVNHRDEHNNENKVYYVENIEFASYEKIIYVEICNETGYEYRYID